ncbi:MAG: glycine betaine ABC transporter substrate-binding protein [Gemmataceae bacterium]
MPRPFWALLVVGCLGCSAEPDTQPVVHVGSKAFAESVILGDLVRHLAISSGATAVHHERLGDTSKTWQGLLSGELDAYVEYTGTLTQEILAEEKIRTPAQLRQALAQRGLEVSEPLGFRNNYALGMRESVAREHGIRTLSDLARHPTLRLGLSHPFIERGDGWHGLKRRYNLPFETPRGMDHGLAYQALVHGSLDVIDLYTTDAQILRYGLRVLVDDRAYFPAYDAVLLYRADLRQKAPRAIAAALRLQGQIDERSMQEMNLRVDVDRIPETVVAADFLRDHLNVEVTVEAETRTRRIYRATVQHLLLVGTSLALALATAIPLGILAARRPRLGKIVLGLVGIVQTVPALALLSLLIVVLAYIGSLPLVGKLPAIGTLPAVIALYVYSLLPIVRNTCVGLTDIPLSIRESALALGLSPWDRLRLIELPMASRSILAGIKTAAVINVGFATLGALIGAGGYGQAILSGLDKNDYRLILEGALPAVVLALLVQEFFEIIERWLVPRGLRLKPAQ